MDNTKTSRIKTAPTTLSDGYFLNTLVLEQEMKKRSGIDITSSQFEVDDAYLMQYVPFFEEEDKDRIKKLTDNYKNINSPCSMAISSLEELSEVMTKVHEVSHYHYILGKKHNLKGSFPEYCCSRSSKNVVLSLYEIGFPNAAQVRSRSDHAYVILPFVFAKENITGSIIVDPTYDQLQFNSKIRNAVFVKMGNNWEYTEAITGRDLSPGIICAIDSIKKSQLESIEGYHDRAEFFRQAFNNPVKINYRRN